MAVLLPKISSAKTICQNHHSIIAMFIELSKEKAQRVFDIAQTEKMTHSIIEIVIQFSLVADKLFRIIIGRLVKLAFMRCSYERACVCKSEKLSRENNACPCLRTGCGSTDLEIKCEMAWHAINVHKPS